MSDADQLERLPGHEHWCKLTGRRRSARIAGEIAFAPSRAPEKAPPLLVPPMPEGIAFARERIDSGVTPEALALRLGISLPAALKSAVPRRQSEFLHGRHCALKALHQAGCRAQTVLPTRADRSPRWPEGWTGSLSHCRDHAVAVASGRSDIAGLGVDIEEAIPERDWGSLAAMVLGPEERALHRRMGDMPFGVWVALVFSAKESLYKAVWPQQDAALEFRHARVRAMNARDLSLKIELAGGVHPEYPSPCLFEAGFIASTSHVITVLWRLESRR